MAGVYDPPYPIPYNPIRGTTSAPAGVMPVFNAKDYGVYGDGIHDDTVAGNNCISTAAAVGGTAYFPEGTYLGEFVSPAQSTGYVRIMGAGIDATTFLCKESVSADGAALSLNMPGEIVDCTVDGNGTVVPSTTTYSVLSVGNGLDAGWDFCALRRVRARNINPSVPNNGWNLVVWLSNSAVPLITTLILEDVIVEGPSATNYDAMAINSFDTCFVSNMSLLNLNRSPNFYQGNTLIVKGIHSNGVSGISEVVFDSGVGYVNLSGYESTPTDGPPVLFGSPLVYASDSSFGAGYQLGYANNSQRAYFSNVEVGQSSPSNNPYIGNTMGVWIATNCRFSYQIQVRTSTASGPLHFVNCDFTQDTPVYGIFNSNTSAVVETYIDGGTTNIGSNAMFQGCTPKPGSRIANLTGYNPVGSSVPGTAFSLPASGTAWTNNTGVDGTLFVTAAGTVTDVVVQGVTVGSSLAVGQSVFVPAGGTFTLTYSAAPTLVFVGN